MPIISQATIVVTTTLEGAFVNICGDPADPETKECPVNATHLAEKIVRTAEADIQRFLSRKPLEDFARSFEQYCAGKETPKAGGAPTNLESEIVALMNRAGFEHLRSQGYNTGSLMLFKSKDLVPILVYYEPDLRQARIYCPLCAPGLSFAEQLAVLSESEGHSA
jgi:hypothetical protein